MRYLLRLLLLIIFLCCTFARAPVAHAYSLNDSMTPFWKGNTMINESMLMTSYNGGQPEAPFLFTPTKILSVKNSHLDTEYVQGKDWIYQDGKLKLPSGSAIPYIDYSKLNPPTVTEGQYYHNLQIAVTYTHDVAWQGPIPQYADAALPTTTSKLTHAQPLTIVLYGDSISVGANASGYINAPPLMPSWGQLVVETLQQTYGSPISFLNPSVAGQTSSWGAENVHTLVTNSHPDLVIIAFGMNDGTLKTTTDAFVHNIQTIMNDVHSANPNAEFILVAPMLANPNSTFAGNQSLYKAGLQSLTKVGVVMVDMTRVDQELLNHKTYGDLTGNNINHPNDFLIRWYAQEVAGLLLKPALPTATSTPTPTPTPVGKLGDVNHDGKVDIFDYNILVANFGKTGSAVTGDINHDGKVDIFDYNILVANFGK